jgi:hypothetical protein
MASAGRRWLIGCGVGCGALILIVVAVAVSFFFWLNQPTELLEPGAMIGGDTTGHVEWTLRLEDPGTKGFVDTILSATNEESARDMAGLPPVVRSWLLKYQGRQNEKEVRELFPLAVAWTIHPGRTPEEDVQLISASIKKLGNKLAIADWVMGMTLSRSDDADVISHGGENIFSFANSSGKDVVLFIRKNHIFFATDIEAARRAIDRLREPVAVSGAGDVRGLLQAIADERSLRGALTNERGELRRLWQRLVGSDDLDRVWDNVSAFKVSGGFREGENFGGLIELRCRDASWARANAENIGTALSSALQRTGLDIEATSRAGGEWVEVEIELKRVQDLFKTLLRKGKIRIE